MFEAGVFMLSSPMSGFHVDVVMRPTPHHARQPCAWVWDLAWRSPGADGGTPSPGCQDCTAHRQTGPRGPPWRLLRLTEGFGVTALPGHSILEFGISVKTTRVGAVSYLNSKPLIENWTTHAPDAELSLDLPSRLADGLGRGQFDVALIPSIAA